jgi:hypothetical protein
MRKEIFSDWIYEFDAPKGLVEETLAVTSSLEYESSVTYADQTVDWNLQFHPDLKKLYEWAYECMDYARKDLTVRTSEFKIVLSWVNKSPKGRWHHGHRHPNSWISGLFYLTDSGASTWLSRPSMWCDESVNTLILPKENGHIIYQNKSEAGKLILFPSTLWHSVSEHDRIEPRQTLSFNAIPWGIVGDNTTLGWYDTSILG